VGVAVTPGASVAVDPTVGAADGGVAAVVGLAVADAPGAWVGVGVAVGAAVGGAVGAFVGVGLGFGEALGDGVAVGGT
jgi:hypothetical protein